MATQDGPQYPGPQDGLVFCFDPKNQKCWSGGDIFTSFSPNSQTLWETGMASDEVANALDGYVAMDGTDTRITGSLPTLYNGDRAFSTWFKSPNWKDITFDYILTLGGFNVAQPSWKPLNYIQIGNNNGDDRWNIIRLGYAHSSNAETVWTNGITPVPGDLDFIGSDYWYNVTISYVQSTGVYTCYLNAAQTGRSNVTITQQDTAGYYDGNAYLGYLPTSGDAFTGDQGPTMVWNRALSEEEVISSYNALKGRYGR